MEVKIAQTMVTKAFDNDKVDGKLVKAFRKVRRKLKKGSNARKRIFTFEEYVKLKDATSSHIRHMIIIAFNTGMRAGEIRQLCWQYISREDGFIRLPEKLTKEGKPKSIPINHHVAKVLDDIPKSCHHDFVITFKDNPITQKGGYKRSFKTACKNAGIPYGRKIPNGVTFHDLRRTVKTNMLNAGVDKVHRDMILGHSLEGMDVNYLVESDEALTLAMVRYTEWVDSQFELISADVTQSVTQN